MKPILLKEIVGRAQFDQFQNTVLIEKCPVSMEGRQQNKHLFRGSDMQQNYVRYDPTTRNRKARDTNNFSLLFTEGLDSWKDAKIPARRHSVIFTPDKSTAREYGDNHLIFFEGDPIIAHGDAGDNYNNYSTGFQKSGLNKADIHSVEVLDSVMANLLDYFNIHHKEVFGAYNRRYLNTVDDPESVAKLVELMENEMGKVDAPIFKSHVEDVMWSYREKDRMNKFFELIRTQGLVDTLSVAYDPAVNRIRAILLSDFFKNEKRDVELWSSGAYYLTPLYLSLETDVSPGNEL